MNDFVTYLVSVSNGSIAHIDTIEVGPDDLVTDVVIKHVRRVHDSDFSCDCSLSVQVYSLFSEAVVTFEDGCQEVSDV